MALAPSVRTLARVPDCEGPTIARDGVLSVVSLTEGRVYDVALSGGARPRAVTHGGPNGLTEGVDGTLYVAQMGSRLIAPPQPPTTGGVQAIAGDGSVSFLTTDPISPNDLCFGPDGLLYVTDPTRQQPWVDGRLWRCDVASGHAELLRSLPWYPNGIGFGPDGWLYVAAMSLGMIMRFPLADDGALGEPTEFATLDDGVPDGFAFDVDGNLVVGAIHFDEAPGSLQVFDPSGRLVDRLAPGPHSRYTNLAIDADGTAYVTCTDGGEVLAIDGWARPGLTLHPFRT